MPPPQPIAAILAELAADLRARATVYRAKVTAVVCSDEPARKTLIKANEWEKFAVELEKVAESIGRT